MGTKITSVQNSKDCGIIFLLRDDHTGLRGAVQIIERPFGVGSAGRLLRYLDKSMSNFFFQSDGKPVLEKSISSVIILAREKKFL